MDAPNTQLQENDLQKRLKSFQANLLHNPKDLQAQIECGNLCVGLGKFEEAAGYFRRIVRIIKSEDARKALCYALEALGNQSHALGRFAQAQACFEEALEHFAGNAIYWYNLGNAQRELGKPQLALKSFQQSILLDPLDADAHNNCGNIQRELGQLDKAILSYETALTLNPNLHHALAHWVHQKQHMCDWENLDIKINILREIVKVYPSAQISPFAFLAMPNTTAQEQKQCAHNYVNATFGQMVLLREQLKFKYRNNPAQKTQAKLKIGYLSADFRLHPLAFLITELIESHDKTQFETFAYSYGMDDKTPARKRLEKAFTAFNDIRALTDVEAANKINTDGIDILVDLTGFTQSSRTAIVALKPAPISINWLGYPGTMGEFTGEFTGELAGKPLFDYIFVDQIIAPNAADFSEQLLYLPCYQPNNSTRVLEKNGVAEFVTQKDLSLPEGAFVFCCFNQSFKITAEIFASWMHILHAVPNSVLWLLDCNAWAKANLQRAANLANVESSRLIFAPRVSITAHLARHEHADLFLDTLPYNAHTTASDALYMGLPVLTCMGQTFASRVCASLLTTLDCDALITTNLHDYTQKAIAFAQNPAQLTAIKQNIQQNHLRTMLFNPKHFVQQIEKHYLEINSLANKSAQTKASCDKVNLLR